MATRWGRRRAEVDYIQEAAATNPLPGSPDSPLVAQQNDSDYYFAGVYPDPIGVVGTDELGFERAFAGANNTLRVHSNLLGVNPTDNLTVSFEAINLDGNGADPRYGIEVWVNGNQVMSEMIIRDAELNTIISTPSFTAASVGIDGSAGFDNIVELRGINHNGDAVSGGNWMGIDYTQLDATPGPEPSAPMFLLLGAAGIAFLRRRR